MRIRIAIAAAMLCLNLAQATGLNWPDNQLLPTFSTPAPVIDAINVSSVSGVEMDLFSSLEGIVNRTQPRIACVNTADGEGEFTWLNLHNLPYNLISGYSAILKYETNVTGLVVTDPNQPDTLNLATTIAGVKNELICDPSLLATLTNAPYNLRVVDDLRGMFSSNYQVYNYLYSNYWPQCTHRLLAGLEPGLHGELRDYLVATKTATVWLDPATLNFTDKSVLAQFASGMTPADSVYIGWWPNEGNGLSWIAQYGIPVLASDYLCNASLYGGVSHMIHVPDIPPPPPLQNKVYVSLILSDGDNIQYMQHAMKIRWADPARGSFPIGWTVSPLAADVDPAMLDYYWSTATKNDCLISGPSGAGYTHMENWSAANLGAYARLSNLYLQRSGLKVITIWDQVTTGIAQAFANSCPTLLGLTDQSGGAYTSVNNGLCTIGLAAAYSSSTTDIISSITNAARNWNGSAPLFIAAQAVTWNLTPTDLSSVVAALNTNEYVLVRPDQLFLLYNHVAGPPQAVTTFPAGITAGGATLRGMVVPNAVSASAWLEWGTNAGYGSKSAVTSVSGNSLVPVNATISGLAPGTVYHYCVASSNVLGVVYGADKQFTTGGRLKSWGQDNSGDTGVPPGLTNVVGIACGEYHGLAIKNDGTVVAWGLDSTFQTNVPGGLSNVIQVAGGIEHSLALNADGTVTAWGGDAFNETHVPAGLNNAVSIAAGGYDSMALKTDSTVTVWGHSGYGETNVPSGLTNAVAIAAGYGHNLALKADGTVVAWGLDSSGQTNVPAGLDHVVAVTAGQYDSMAIKADGITPANLHPVCRWVADSLTGTNGMPVNNWVDEIGGRNATQPTFGNQPRFYSGVLNGHNTVRFSSASSQYLTVAAADSPISGATDFTLVVVLQTSTPGDSSSSFFQNTGLLGCEQPNVVPDWALCINDSELGAGLGAGSSGCSADVSLYGGNVTDGKPHIATYVRAGGTISLYVDGTLVASQSSLCTDPRGNYSFQIGAMTAGSHFFNGDIAEIQLYNRALNPWEIGRDDETLAATYGMSGTAGAPASRWVADNLAGGNGSSVSKWTDIFGGAIAVQGSSGNQPRLVLNAMNGHNVVRFSSANHQYLTVAATNSAISAAGSFTLVVVFQTSAAGNPSSSFYNNTGLLGAEQPNIVQDWALCINGNQLGAGLGAGTGGCGSDLSLYGGNVTDGKPHIAVYVRSGDAVSLYVDGVQVAGQSSLCTAARGNYNFQIGAMTTSSYFYNGDIAEIQLYNRALDSWGIMSLDEVLAAAYGINTGIAGSVVVWGDNTYGQANVPKGLASVVAGACGSDFNLALASNGKVTAWGDGSLGQTNIPAGLTNVADLAGGTGFGLAIADQTPYVSNVVVSGFVNHDLTITLPGTDPDGRTLTYYISTLPVVGALYQYSGGVRGASIADPNTAVSDSGGRVVFAPASGQTGSPYASFGFTAADALYNSDSAQASVNIGLPASPQFTGYSWNPGASGSGNFALNFTGDSNATYSVWASTNLLDWTSLGTATENPPGQYEFIDSTVTNWPDRFYRLSSP